MADIFEAWSRFSLNMSDTFSKFRPDAMLKLYFSVAWLRLTHLVKQEETYSVKAFPVSIYISETGQ